MDIHASVGKDAANNQSDVRVIQLLLQQNMASLVPAAPAGVSGTCDSQTVFLIEQFQRRVMQMDTPNGRVDPNSPTLFGLNGQSGPAVATDPILQLALDSLRTEFLNFAQRFIQDKDVRAEYVAKAEEASEDVLKRVKAGELTVAEGAAEANETRNGLLQAARLKSSDIGNAAAQAEKASGLTMDELITKYSSDLFHKEFSALGTAEQDAVFLKIIEKAGQPNPKWTRITMQLGEAGKGLIIISIALSVYSIAASDRPGREAVKQGVGAGVGFLGSLAGGAAAGLVCGPGAPICVGVGAFVGGLVFVVSSDFAFDEIWD
jgi:hypothetical protein